MSKIKVPTDLNEIPLIQFLQWDNIEGDEERARTALRIFCDVGDKEFSTIPYNTVQQVLIRLAEVVNKTPEFQDRFEMNGIKYGFVPNLDEITTGEYVDIDEYLKDPQNFYKVMGVLYRPVVQEGQGGKYSIAPYRGIINEDFKYMPSGVAMGAKVFFYHIGKDLLAYIRKFLSQRRGRQMRTTLAKSGVGLDSYISYLEAILQEWNQLQQCPYKRLYSGGLTNQTFQKWKNESLTRNEKSHRDSISNL